MGFGFKSFFNKPKKEDLLRMLREQEVEIKELKEQLQKQKKQNENQSKCIEAGNIAESALIINNVFETAQKAANLYLEEVKQLREDTKNEYRKTQLKAKIIAKKIMQDAKAEAEEYKHQQEELMEEIWLDMKLRVDESRTDMRILNGGLSDIKEKRVPIADEELA